MTDEKYQTNKEEKPQKYTPVVISFREVRKNLLRIAEPDISTLKFDLLERRDKI